MRFGFAVFLVLVVGCGSTESSGSAGGTGGAGGSGGTGATASGGGGAGGTSGVGGAAGAAGTGGAAGSPAFTPLACPSNKSGSPPPERGICNADGFCFENPLPLDTTVYGIFGLGPNDVWATGEDDAILHFDGSKWEVREFGYRGVPMNAAWGASTNDVWIVGGFYDTQGFYRHWDGTKLSTKVITSAALRSVHGQSASDVWAVGRKGLVLRYDGSQWATVTTPATLDLDAVRSFGQQAFVGGADTLLRYDGSNWSSLGLASGARVRALWGTSASDVWIGGEDAQKKALLLRWDGSKLTSVASSGGAITAISGSGASDVWVADLDGATQHFDGNALQAGGQLGAPVRALWVAAAGDVFAASDAEVLPVRGDGATFKLQAPELAELRAVWGPSLDDVWAGGTDGTLMHFDGASWKSAPSPVTGTIIGVWGTSTSDIWAIVSNGEIARFDGGAWKVEAKHSDFLSSFVGVAPGTLWLVTSGHEVVRYAQGSFEPILDPPFPPSAIWASSANDAWVVGGKSVAHFDGSAWTETQLQTFSTFDVIWGRSPEDIWVSGFIADGQHFDGKAWTPVFEADSATFIWGCGTSDVWFAKYPDMAHLQGQSWTTLDMAWDVRSLWGAPDDLLTVGVRGGITSKRPTTP